MITECGKAIKELKDRLMRKDRENKELRDMLIHVISVVETYGWMDHDEANPEWEPPVYLRNGEYTMDERLKDIRRHTIEIRKAAFEARQLVLGFESDVYANY